METIVGIYPKLEQKKDYHYFPFGLLKVGSIIQEYNYFDIIDERIVNNVYEEIDNYNEGEQQFYFSVYAGYQVTRAYVLTNYILSKNSKAKISWGGPFVDAFMNDKGIFPEYIKPLPGYAERRYKHQCEINWDLININKYISDKNRFMYITSYGCPGSCTFCANINKRKWIEVDFELIEKDIENLMKKHKFEECVIFDATCFTRGDRTLKIGQLMNKHSLKWIADARADEIIRINRLYRWVLASIIKNTKLQQLTIGLETGSQKVAEKMNKMRDHFESYQRAMEILRKFDINVVSGVIFGTPGEGLSELKETINYLKKMIKINPRLRFSTTFYMPLPNTQMAIMAEKNGWRRPQTIKDWAEYGEKSHFKYNEFMDNPWIKDKKEYKKLYDEFLVEFKNYLI